MSLWLKELPYSQASSLTLLPEFLRLLSSGSRTSTHPQSGVFVPAAMPPKTCGHLSCYLAPSVTVGLSRTKWEVHRSTYIWVFQILYLWCLIPRPMFCHPSVVVLLSCRSHAASKLKLLHSGGWLGRRTVALKVQFTLFSPAPNWFTSVTLLSQQSPTGVLLPSAKVQSVRVYRTPAVWDYAVMVCQVNCDITFHLQKTSFNGIIKPIKYLDFFVSSFVLSIHLNRFGVSCRILT